MIEEANPPVYLDPTPTIELIDSLGDDLTVVNRARKSHDGYTDTLREKDTRLISYLGRGMRASQEHELVEEVMGSEDPQEVLQLLRTYRTMPPHWTPFAHVQLVFRITAPLTIARQWFRHEQGMVRSELSRRYVKTTPTVLLPTFRYAPEEDIKQGSGGVLPPAEQGRAQALYAEAVNKAGEAYFHLINDCRVAPEQARMVLPQGMMTTWEETGSLYAYARLANARLRSDVQSETRSMAEDIQQQARTVAPHSWAALVHV